MHDYQVLSLSLAFLACLSVADAGPECNQLIHELNEIMDEEGGHIKPLRRYDEVYPGIILGDGPTALNVPRLKSLGVTHVLNTAEWIEGDEMPHLIATPVEEYYTPNGIKYHGLHSYNIASFDLTPFYNATSEFIHDAVTSKGNVYVHCFSGNGRSGSLVMAYLMIKQDYNAKQALLQVRGHREVTPNDGHIEQLCHLDLTLAAERNNA